jgi:MtN3 and saliva related transmembrane protein
MNPEIFGFIAGLTVATSLTPQIIKAWRTKSTNDISLIWTSIYMIGLIFWVIYGTMINSPSLIITISIEIVLLGSLIILKLKHG